jgi:uncharacterized repeat protein (TIGR03803 family)
MNTASNRILLLLLAGIGAALTCGVPAQTFKTLHSFTGSDGSGPAEVILSGDTLYGMTEYGGSYSNGSVYAVKIDGTGFKTLHSFTPLNGSGPSPVNSDGAAWVAPGNPQPPQLGLVLSGTTLYGTACTGGINGSGTVFKVSTDGTGFAVLHYFAGTNDGAYPVAGLVLSGNTLYGTTSRDYPGGLGKVFRINTDGTQYEVVVDFDTLQAPGGQFPDACLTISSNTLYGTTFLGGGVGFAGTVFKVNTDGTGFSVLHAFNGLDGNGSSPRGGLLILNNRLYGSTTQSGGPHPLNIGTVFAVNTDGTDFKLLRNLTNNFFNADGTTNYDGLSPEGGLTLLGNKLYGTTSSGNVWNWGTVFEMNLDGTGFQNLHIFSEGMTDTALGGASPSQTMVSDGNMLYGTTLQGGTTGNGTVFSLSLPATTWRPAVSLYGSNIVVKWPTNAVGTLQSCTNLAAPVWTPVHSGAFIVNGQNAITNPISGTQQFFRLSQ